MGSTMTKEEQLTKEDQLWRACEGGRLDEAKQLVDEGVDVESTNGIGRTPIINAAANGHVDIIRFLLDRGANIDRKDIGGNTALHRAAYWDEDEAARLLIERGANLHIKDNRYGYTPLDRAKRNHQSSTAAIIEAAMKKEEAAKKEVHVTSSAVKKPSVIQSMKQMSLQQNQQQKGGSDSSSTSTLPLPHNMKYHVFLTHNWGPNNQNHNRVSLVNDELKRRGVVTWFDTDRMQGNIANQMAGGINNSVATVVFVTNDYVIKVAGKGRNGNNDNCKLEFEYACEQRSVDNLIVVEMENTKKPWIGSVGLYAGKLLHYSFKKDRDLESCVDDIMNEIQQRIWKTIVFEESLNLY